ncbi:SAV_2336 N-terminal domain-related protein, partial [Amycolatopsis coloradensis]|uniref:SAV_2336 N-terminal domain-related protein n=1 Tax=Amycolatopsis coloradensis TaxID=76021 RepID=UPI0033F70339
MRFWSSAGITLPISGSGSALPISCCGSSRVPDNLERIASAVAAAVNVDARTLADALWLAAATSSPAQDTPEPVNEPEPQRKGQDLPSRQPRDRSSTTQPQLQSTATGTETAATPLSERRVSGTPVRGTPVRAPVPPPLPQADAIARALRPFTRPWRQSTATLLDIDATVDRFAEHRVLVPVLRTAPERWFDVVVVVDDAPTMAVWHDTITDFVRVLSLTGFFRAVHRWSLTDAAVKDHLGRSAVLADAVAMARVPQARRLILVVSDFASTAWRGPALWELVAAWARATPAALINPLPVRFWAHSGINLPTVRAMAVGPPGPTSSLRFKVPLRARLTDDSWLPVPALTLTPAALDRWARSIVRTDPEGCDAVLVPAHRVAPPLAPTTPGPAAEAFLRTAAAPAARLALMSAPFERFSLALLRLLQAKAVPEAEPADLAELLTSGLATIDDPLAANPVLTYRSAARNYSLDHVTANDVWTANQALSSFIATHPDVTPSMLALAHTPDGQEALPAELRPFAAATTETLRLLGMIPKESLAPTGNKALSNLGTQYGAGRRAFEEAVTQDRVETAEYPAYSPSDQPGREAEAEQAYRDAAAAGNTDALYNLGVLLASQPGREAEAEQAYRDAAAAGNTHALYNLGVLLASQPGREAEAEQAYRDAAAASNTHALYNLGVLLASQPGREAEAEQAYRDAAAGNTHALFNLGNLLANQLGREAEAEQAYRDAAAAGDAKALKNLGALLSRQPGREAEAKQAYRDAAAGNTKALFNLGNLLAKPPGRETEAAQAYRDAAAGNTKALFNLGNLLANQPGREAEAEQALRAVAAGGDAKALKNLGALLSRQPGREAEAEQAFRDAAAAGSHRALNNLGNLLAKQPGREAEAEQIFRDAAAAGSHRALNNLGNLLAKQPGREAEAE